MREAFHDQLVALEDQLTNALEDVCTRLAGLGDAICSPGEREVVELARAAEQLRQLSRGVDQELVIVTARQAPVAGDLRLVLALIQLAHHAGLIANQFQLISEQLDAVDSNVADRQLTGERLSEMTILGAAQLRDALAAFTGRNVTLAQRINTEDDAIDELNRQVFEATFSLDAPSDERELALRHVLIARSLERIGDNAVDIAEQVAFLAEGRVREFTDASQPRKRPAAFE
jgi:phosphate transport system protein